MPAHTPAPWRLEKDAQGPCAVMHPQKKGVAIANLQSLFVPVNGYVGDDEERRPGWANERTANANLIAAAPLLAAALAEYLKDDADSDPEWGPSDNAGPAQRALDAAGLIDPETGEVLI